MAFWNAFDNLHSAGAMEEYNRTRCTCVVDCSKTIQNRKAFEAHPVLRELLFQFNTEYEEMWFRNGHNNNSCEREAYNSLKFSSGRPMKFSDCTKSYMNAKIQV